jgi:type I restriction enzyme R subunit
LVFEIELIKQVEINVDYILMLVQKYKDSKGDGDDIEVRASIDRAIDSSPTLRNKKDLIEAFVDSLSADSDVDEAWRVFVAAKRTEELDRIIADENLDAAATRTFVDIAFRDGALATSGTAVVKILPPVSRFASDGGHGLKKQTVLDKLQRFFERFVGLG